MTNLIEHKDTKTRRDDYDDNDDDDAFRCKMYDDKSFSAQSSIINNITLCTLFTQRDVFIPHTELMEFAEVFNQLRSSA